MTSDAWHQWKGENNDLAGYFNRDWRSPRNGRYRADTPIAQEQRANPTWRGQEAPPVGVRAQKGKIASYAVRCSTQIFLELSARYDALLHTSSFGVWMSTEAQLPAATHELTAYVLRYCSLVYFCYFMFQQRRIPRKMWTLMLPSIERTLHSPLFVREWKTISFEFQSVPDFFALVEAAQEKSRTSGPALV